LLWTSILQLFGFCNCDDGGRWIDICQGLFSLGYCWCRRARKEEEEKEEEAAQEKEEEEEEEKGVEP
jgi:hypothetical protein